MQSGYQRIDVSAPARRPRPAIAWFSIALRSRTKAGRRALSGCPLRNFAGSVKCRSTDRRANQAKTGSRRVIPITDNLAAWLEPLKRKGLVVPTVKAHYRAVAALVASLGIAWPRNVLRHSFIFYRIAIVKSADQVALEAGNSPSIIFKNYRELTTEEQAAEWFGIVPKTGQDGNPA